MRRRYLWLVHLLAAVGITWPLAWHLRTSLEMGFEHTPTVPLFNLWSLQWNAQRFGHALNHYWDAPIFAPTRGTFARSEAQPLTGLLFAAFRSITGPVGAYNLVLLTFLTLNGIAAHAVARRLGASAPAAMCTGFIAQLLPFVWQQLGVLQLVCVFPMLFVFERILAYRGSQRLRDALGISFWFVICALTSGYYAIFLIALCALWLPVLLLGAVAWRKLAVHAIIAGGVALVCVVPYFVAQRQQLTDADVWKYTTVAQLSARPADYLEQFNQKITVPIFRDDANGNGITESPGVYLSILALGGLVVGLRRRQRRVVAATIGGAGLMAVCSFGTTLSIFGWHPYRFLYDNVPGFSRLRSPFRFSAGLQVCLVILAAFALSWLWQWQTPLGARAAGERGWTTPLGARAAGERGWTTPLGARAAGERGWTTPLGARAAGERGWIRFTGGRVLALGVVLLFALEVGPFGVSLTSAPNVAAYGWVHYLHDAKPGNVAMVPFPADGHASSFADTTVAMLASLEHGHALVNGYTGLFPKQHDAPLADGGLWYAMDNFPDRCSVEQLHLRDVKYIVAREDWYTQDLADAMSSYGYREVYRSDQRVVLVDEKEYVLHHECA